MRILIVDVYYPDFLDKLYSAEPGLGRLPYEQQWAQLMENCFGTADFYSKNLRALGHEAHEIVFNAAPLQSQWVCEHGVRLREREWNIHKRWHGIPLSLRRPRRRWPYEVLLEQIRDYRPDVLHMQDMNTIGPDFVREIRGFVKLIGQTAYAIPEQADYGVYDLVVTSLPHYVKRFRRQGLRSELLRLAFEPDLLPRLVRRSPPHEATHIGGYRAVHRERNELLEHLLKRGIPLECWGYGVEALSAESPIRAAYRGEAWGLEMHEIRHNSRVVVSRHVASVANVHANIMTMYEATGVGSLLAIDMRQDLADLFDPENEILAYRDSEECAEKIRYFLEHENERSVVARAGQARTLRDHTYFNRMREYCAMLQTLK